MQWKEVPLRTSLGVTWWKLRVGLRPGLLRAANLSGRATSSLSAKVWVIDATREAKAHNTPGDHAGCTREHGESEARTPEGSTMCQRLRNRRSA